MLKSLTWDYMVCRVGTEDVEDLLRNEEAEGEVRGDG